MFLLTVSQKWTQNEFGDCPPPPPPTPPHALPHPPPAFSNLLPLLWCLFSYRTAENTSKVQIAKKTINLSKETIRFGAFSFGRVPPSDPSRIPSSEHMRQRKNRKFYKKNNKNTAQFQKILLRLWVSFLFSSHPAQ